MKMKRSREVSVSMVVWVMLFMLRVDGASGRQVYVGGREGWHPDINYTLWASQETLYVGDWLFFRFDKNYYDVLEVDQTNYEKCNPENFIANITKGGRDVYQLREARPYYFICSKGYCYSGMKLAIDVKNLSPPAPSPQGNHAAGPSLCAGNLSFMLILVLPLFSEFLLLIA